MTKILRFARPPALDPSPEREETSDMRRLGQFLGHLAAWFLVAVIVYAALLGMSFQDGFSR